MSKMDNQRAMREAKWARTEAAAAARRPADKTAAKAPVAPEPSGAPDPKKRATKASASASTTPTETGALCGHSSMNGRTCTREAGHSEKSHRYS